MTVRGHHERTRPGKPILHHDLVSDTTASRVEFHTLLLGKLFNLPVFLQILFGLVLHIMVEGHNNLLRVVQLGGPDGHELERNGPRVVVGHTTVRRDGNIVAGLDELILGQAHGITLDDFLGKRLGHGSRRLEGRVNGGRRGIIQLRMKDLLETKPGRGKGTALQVIRHRAAQDCSTRTAGGQQS